MSEPAQQHHADTLRFVNVTSMSPEPIVRGLNQWHGEGSDSPFSRVAEGHAGQELWTDYVAKLAATLHQECNHRAD